MKTYADTSFLFSLYATDANSTRADAWRQANPAPLPFTAFHRLELRNALSLALFQQRLTLAEVQAAWQEVENDCAAGLLVGRGGLWHRVLVEAESSALNDTPVVGCRTLDVLHVATAKLIGMTEFCSFDTRQSGLAGRVGLVAVSP
ncbi:MAG TPA: type II toxin-antitoxin system VapC family toxin [Opitutaceae bacterium]|nr:type II toxin-antitoxin system VapC family toxin [Opitutaceae bacterium]